jgi:hypothetical protein
LAVRRSRAGGRPGLPCSAARAAKLGELGHEGVFGLAGVGGGDEGAPLLKLRSRNARWNQVPSFQAMRRAWRASRWVPWLSWTARLPDLRRTWKRSATSKSMMWPVFEAAKQVGLGFFAGGVDADAGGGFLGEGFAELAEAEEGGDRVVEDESLGLGSVQREEGHDPARWAKLGEARPAESRAATSATGAAVGGHAAAAVQSVVDRPASGHGSVSLCVQFPAGATGFLARGCAGRNRRRARNRVDAGRPPPPNVSETFVNLRERPATTRERPATTRERPATTCERPATTRERSSRSAIVRQRPGRP